MEREAHVIDAAGKVLGRLATEIAILLRGKQKADYAPYKDMGDLVIVKNVDKIKLTGKKTERKTYYRHTGYLGGLKEIPFKRIFKADPAKILRKAVLGMLPKNRLRAKQIKRLKME